MDGFTSESAFLTNVRGPFGATTANVPPSNPPQSSEHVFLVDAASHESSGAHLGQFFEKVTLEDFLDLVLFGRPFEATRGFS